LSSWVTISFSRRTLLYGIRTQVMKPHGRHSRMEEDTIKMDLRETGFRGGGWMELAQGRVQSQAVVNAVTNRWVPYGQGVY